MDQLAACTRLDGDQEVVDVGTGTGLVAAGLAQHARRVLAYDNSAAMLAVARAKLDRLGIAGGSARPLSAASIRKLMVALIEAADAQEHARTMAAMDGRHTTRDEVARLVSAGRRPKAIADELGLAKATVSFHLRNLGATRGPCIGRGMIVAMLGRSGLRVSEL